jgi:XTP/dITP diphosphohydrolase
VKLLVATRNQGKEREIRDLFTGLPLDVVFPADQFLERLPEEADLERGATFIENAVAKARYFAKRSGLPTLGEDSGLEVDVLNGAPGVHSARYAALYGDEESARGIALRGADVANNQLLLCRLANVPEERRAARYRCVVAFVHTPAAAPQLVEATCEGRILAAPRGSDGFGYDPLFFAVDLGVTFAEASLAAKQRVSHRGRAWRALIEVLLRRYARD